jgi:hypothetical protein
MCIVHMFIIICMTTKLKRNLESNDEGYVQEWHHQQSKVRLVFYLYEFVSVVNFVNSLGIFLMLL